MKHLKEYCSKSIKQRAVYLVLVWLACFHKLWHKSIPNCIATEEKKRKKQKTKQEKGDQKKTRINKENDRRNI